MLCTKIINVLTYKSRAEIDGGSAMNSKSGGGSLGINGCSTCFRISCCFNCAAGVTDNFWIAWLRPGAGSEPTNHLYQICKELTHSLKNTKS